MSDWANALEEEVEPWARLAPGVLLSFCNEAEIAEVAKDPNNPLSATRKGFKRRISDTSGIIISNANFEGSSIFIKGEIIKQDNVIEKAFKTLRKSWETPDGNPFLEAVDLARHARELSCGFYYRWNPAPPMDWLQARKEWNSFVRRVLGSGLKQLDSEEQVSKACLMGELEDSHFRAWQEIRGKFKIKTEPVWLSDKMISIAQKWLEKNAGICWVNHKAFGHKLAEITGLPYYRGEGLCQNGQYIEDGSGAIIASIKANSEGRNLQYKWNKNLIIGCPAGGDIWEQLMGRTHREGQTADEVSVQVMIGCLEDYKAFIQAQNDAVYVKDTMGQDQKITYADIDMLSAEKIKVLKKDKKYTWGA